MAEPTSALGFYDVLLRIAEKAGMAYYGSNGQGKAIAPVDAFNLDKCKRIINDGFRLFVASPPAQGWLWQERMAEITLAATEIGTATAGAATTLTDDTQNTDLTYVRTEANDYFNDWLLTITAGTGVGESAIVTDYVGATRTVTFSGGLSGGSTPDTTSIYQIEKVNLMPEDFNGEVDGAVSYAQSTNHGTEIELVDESLIRAIRADYISTGYPTKVAIVPYRPVAGTLGARRWELLTDYASVGTDVLNVPYTSHFNQMDCETGTATAGAATSLTDSGRGEADDYFNGWILTIIAGTGLGETATVTDDYASGVFSFTALSGGSTPDTTSVYYVEPASNLHPAGVKFDECILQACYAEAEKQIEEINEGMVELYYKVSLPSAHKMDSRSRPRKLRSKRAIVRGRYSVHGGYHGGHRTWHNITQL